MPDRPTMSILRTDRLTLRPQEVQHAHVFRQLWTERDDRVPAHRQIDAHGHPTVQDIATNIAGESGQDGGPPSEFGRSILTVREQG